MKREIVFHGENETSQTVVYKEDNDLDPVIGTLYVRKYALADFKRENGAFPNTLRVTVEADK